MVVFGLAIGLTLGLASPAQAEALLSIREAVLQQQQDRILIGFDAKVVKIGKVHRLSDEDDCDVHVPLITTALLVALLAEIKNACTIWPTGQVPQDLERLGRDTMRVEGAFRVWFEGHDEDVPFREENRDPPASHATSGPPHLVELHPLTRLGPMDLLHTVRMIEKNGRTIGWKGDASFKRALHTKVKIKRHTHSGLVYVQVRCACGRLANHYKLHAEISFGPHDTESGDGTLATARIVDEDGRVVQEQVRLFAIKGTPAYQRLRDTVPGDDITIFALARLSLRPLLSKVSTSERTIDLPVELVLLHARTR